jgi:4-hydroxybenzoyl-CoA reductase subunit beta
MMRLPDFEFVMPATLAEAARVLAASPETAMLLAGGTDLIPNMKRRQQTPQTVISLSQLAELREIRNTGGWTIGAGATLTSIVRHGPLRQACPGLWQAATQIATPLLQNMGTVGGNLCLDTRCTYYDQSEDWRKAIGYCMKKDGSTCWVATSSPTCLAVSSTDLAPMLIALGARVRLVSTSGDRTIDVADLYENDGMRYLTRRANEILADVTVADQRGWRSAYWKLRRRGSFDFPVASAAVAIKCDPAGRVLDVRIVVGAVASRPMVVSNAAEILVGHVLTDDRVALAADAAYDVAKPMDNTDFELHWRKKMIRPLVRSALREVRGDDVRDERMRLARRSLLATTEAM